MANNLFLSEIFSAIQGEGPLVGIRQIFIRLSGCDIRCAWCDTPDSLIRSKYCEIETASGSRIFKKVENPFNFIKLKKYISDLSPKLHHSISLTGGEPLLQDKAFLEVLPELKKTFSLPLYLETGGHRPDKLEQIINTLDYISMDFKLSTSTGEKAFWKEHKEFISIALKSKHLKKIWVKITITNKTSEEELIKAVNIVKKFNKGIEIFIQPVSKIDKIIPPDEKKLLSIQKKLLNIYPHIRVLPQVHRMIEQK